MDYVNKIIDLGMHPSKIIPILGARGFFHSMPDSVYLEKCFKSRLGYKLNLRNPTTYNEKLQWLKLYDRKPLYTQLADKCDVKDWVAEKIGVDHVIPTYGIWDKFDDIDFDVLPDSFVLKCTHDSGGLVLCRNKGDLDYQSAKKKINKSLKNEYFFQGREWPYKNIKPRIIAERYIESDTVGNDLPDYKFFCFNGKVELMFIATERSSKEETKFDFYDRDFNHLPFTNGHPNSRHKIERPQHFNEMISLAEKLSEGIPHVRVDFYETKNGVLFGEMTFFHWGGFVPFVPCEWDERIGSYISLPGQFNNKLTED